MTTPSELLELMGAQLRTGEWAHLEPAPVFAAEPAGVAPAVPSSPIAGLTGEAASTAASVAAGAITAGEIVEGTLTAIAELQPQLNVFTSVFADTARSEAEAVDSEVRADAQLPLAGVPFAVKDLFDVAGVTTLAGSRARADDPPAVHDATVVACMRDAGAVLVGATNMDEFAYGFTTENSHYGPTRNPHDPGRIAGGSSGGSAAAVAAGIVPIAFGTDTNGSVRIPASFCGVYGLRPTFGTVPLTGATLFASSFDAVGPFARSAADIALALEVVAPGRNLTSFLELDRPALAAARAAGELWDGVHAEVAEAAERVAEALGAGRVVELPEVGRARAAAMVITAAEGADQHQELLRTDPEIVDPRVRGRFLAGLEVAATDYLAAQRFRRWWQAKVLELLAEVDVLVLPTVAFTAPLIDQPTIELGGITLPTGAVLGRLVQPLSFIGLPALSVPVTGTGALPVGVQLAARPGADGLLIAAAAQLEAEGVIGVSAPAIGRKEGVRR